MTNTTTAPTTFLRKIDWMTTEGAEELANLSDEWTNTTVDTGSYYQTCLTVFEIDAERWEIARKEGMCCQVKDGKYYIGY